MHAPPPSNLSLHGTVMQTPALRLKGMDGEAFHQLSHAHSPLGQDFVWMGKLFTNPAMATAP